MVRTVAGHLAEVVASTFDEPTGEHVHVSDIALGKGQAHGRGRPRRGHPARFDHPLARATTPRLPREAGCSPAVSIPTPCKSRNASSERPGVSRKAAA